MPLTMMPMGRSGLIRKIAGKDETRRHLETLGFVVGEQVVVISEMGGNMIVQVKGSRLAISKSMATRILM